nr:unnamed protein product [Digitaria exilis]
MELLQNSIPMVFLAVSAAALYARAASSCVRPGFPRLLALLPVAALLAAAPLAFPFANIRGLTGFFLGWLGVFKILLFAAGRGPLEPNLPAHQFLFVAALPVKLADRRHGQPGATATSSKSAAFLVSCAVKIAAYKFVDQLHLYMRLALYGVHIYCFFDLLLPCISAVGAALGMEMEPQFDRPYMASSLRDFWGRRWNLVVSAILRPSVYEPLRDAHAGKAAAAIATFLVSGLMHEAMVCYITLRSPTGEMAAFFLLHGACCVAEQLCVQWWVARGWPRPPRPVATVLVGVFVAGTAFWLFFPPICRDGSEERLLEEWAALAEFITGTGRNLSGMFSSVNNS